MNILVLNVGSSSIKFQLVRTDAERMAAGADERLARGQVERIGGEGTYEIRAAAAATVRGAAPLRDHRAAVEFIIQCLASPANGVPIEGVAQIQAAGRPPLRSGRPGPA